MRAKILFEGTNAPFATAEASSLALKHLIDQLIQSLVHILELVLQILRVFFLGLCVALQEFDETTDVHDLLFLICLLALHLLHALGEALYCETGSTHSFQLDLQEAHVSVAVCHCFQILELSLPSTWVNKGLVHSEWRSRH